MPPYFNPTTDDCCGATTPPLLANGETPATAFCPSTDRIRKAGRRRIRFADTNTIYPIHSREDISPDEKLTAWFDHAVLEEIFLEDLARSVRASVSQAAGHKVVLEDDDEICDRGIEDFLTASGQSEKKIRRNTVVLAVLGEQERLRRRRYFEQKEENGEGKGVEENGKEWIEELRVAAAAAAGDAAERALRRGAADAAATRPDRMEQRRKIWGGGGGSDNGGPSKADPKVGPVAPTEATMSTLSRCAPRGRFAFSSLRGSPVVGNGSGIETSPARNDDGWLAIAMGSAGGEWGNSGREWPRSPYLGGEIVTK